MLGEAGSTGPVTVTYDGAYRLQTLSDGNSNPTTYQSSSFAFDAVNRLSSIGSSWTAGYTGEGLRAWQQNSGTTTYYLYDGSVPGCELSNMGGWLGGAVGAWGGTVVDMPISLEPSRRLQGRAVGAIQAEVMAETGLGR